MNHFSTNMSTYPQPKTMSYPIIKMIKNHLKVIMSYNKVAQNVIFQGSNLIVLTTANNIDKLIVFLLRYLHNFSRFPLCKDTPVIHPKFLIPLTI